MATEEQVRQSLEAVLVPAVKRSIVGMNLVREVTTFDKKVNVTLASTGLIPGAQDWIKTKTREAIEKLPEVNEVKVEYADAKAKDLNKIDKILAVMSGKGGVGKSLVSSLVAIGLKRKGYEVGILDADITGPSIPKMFGLTVRPSGNESGILPVPSKSGIEIMSINLLLPREDEPVIWRGSLITSAIRQFWGEVLWEKLETLVIDLPPGTSDATLTVMQTIPLNGILLVTSPQDLAGMVVRKAAGMARMLNIPIIGLIENMSYVQCPDCGRHIEIFGPSRAEEMAEALGVPLLGSVPLDPELARHCDRGEIESYPAEVFVPIASAVSLLVPDVQCTPLAAQRPV